MCSIPNPSFKCLGHERVMGKLTNIELLLLYLAASNVMMQCEGVGGVPTLCPTNYLAQPSDYSAMQTFADTGRVWGDKVCM